MNHKHTEFHSPGGDLVNPRIFQMRKLTPTKETRGHIRPAVCPPTSSLLIPLTFLTACYSPVFNVSCCIPCIFVNVPKLFLGKVKCKWIDSISTISFLKFSHPPSLLLCPQRKTAVVGGAGQLALSDWCCWWVGPLLGRLNPQRKSRIWMVSIFHSNEPCFRAHSKARLQGEYTKLIVSLGDLLPHFPLAVLWKWTTRVWSLWLH